jgi:hypothetical protein
MFHFLTPAPFERAAERLWYLVFDKREYGREKEPQ